MRRWFCLLWLSALVATPAWADDAMLRGLVREPVVLPVTLPSGGQTRLEALVVRPDRAGRFPLALIVHGTPRDPSGLQRMSPAAFLGVAVELATRGYAAVAIMRRGFGRSDGPYAETYAGPCNARDYQRLGKISAEDVLGALATLRSEPWADPSRMVLLGQSTGGFAVTAAAAANPPGVAGVLDFAGGRGSDAPDHVCDEDHLVEAFGAFGRTARIPALWIFSENDHFFGPALAQRMFQAYTAAGAPARLEMLPPVGNDGHSALELAPREMIWSPVDGFLASLRLPTQIVIALPPMAQIPPPPGLNPGCLGGFHAYVEARTEAKAFAVNPEGHCGFTISAPSPEDAKQIAMTACTNRGGNCSLYAVGQSLAAR